MSIDDQARALLTDALTPVRRARARLAEPLRVAEEASVQTPTGAVRAWRLGEGPAVLCVHGWQDDNSLWSPLIQSLAERGIAVVAFDLPGHGFSEGNSCTPLDAAVSIEAVAAQLGPIDALVTHSFGGPAAGIALLNGLVVRRAVLIGASRGRHRRWFAEAADNGVPIEVIERARTLYLEDVGPRYADFDLAGIAPQADALIVHSTDDDAVEWEQAKAIADAWPHAEFVLCDGLGHRMVAQDRAIVARIVDFLA